MGEFDVQMSIEERVNRLEIELENDRKSFLKKAGAWGGLLALFISIILGGWNVYDVFVLQDNIERANDLKRLSELVERSTKLNIDLLLLPKTSDPITMRNVSTVSNGAKLSILGEADRIVEKHPDHIKFADLMVLSSEHLNGGSFNVALKYSRMASKVAPHDGFRAEAVRYSSLALFGSKETYDEGRTEFGRALVIAKSHEAVQRAGIIASILRDWTFAEGRTGNCDKANEVASLFMPELSRYVGGDAIAHNMLEWLDSEMTNQFNCKLR